MTNLLDAIVNFGLECLGRYYSIYRGYVVSNDDPENLLRLKVRVPKIKGIPLNNWAYPKGIYSGKNYGIKFIPKIGDLVWVQFEMGEKEFPVWSYAYPLKGELPEELMGDVAGIKTKYGQTITFNEDGILINGGENGGLLKIDPTLEKINQLEEELNDLKTLITQWVVVLNDGGGALKTLLTSWSTNSITPTTKDELENELVKH